MAQGGSPGAGGTAGNGVGGSSGSAGSSSTPGERNTFYVDGRFLYDRCGEKVLLRGVNEMVVWSGGADGLPEFVEIAKTGANSVRVVWTVKDGTPAGLGTAIENALANELIPIVELHDATGDMTKLQTLVDYWSSPSMVEVINQHSANVLLNIGNEVGDDKVTNEQFETAYTAAIAQIRQAGIRVPLVIDAPTWGQNINVLQATGPALLEADPEHNLLFSVHMWWSDPAGARVKTEIDESVALNLPLIVGEFAQHAVYQCDQSPFDYKTLLSYSKDKEIGWLAWSWGGVKNADCEDAGPFDMSTDGTFEGLTGWGLEVAVSDPNSIQNTAVRPQSILTGNCE